MWWRPDPSSPGTYAYTRFTTNAFFIERELFVRRLGPLQLRLAAPLHVLRGWSAGHPPYRALEVSVSQAMARRKLVRLSLLGPGKGLWTLHRQQRSPALAEKLPGIIRGVERNRVPDEQRGHGRLHESVDWSAAEIAASHVSG